jgi:putative glutamine amidotransferase
MYALMPSYIDAIVEAGGLPIMIPLGLGEEELRLIFGRIDGLLLPGGGDIQPRFYHGRDDVTMWGIDEDRDRVEFFLVRAAVDERKPVLAICRGLQVFNVALGGTLWGDIPSQRRDSVRHDLFNVFPRNHLAHTVDVAAGSVLGRQLGRETTPVNSLHHQGIKELAPELRAAAVAPDGLIEAVEVAEHPYALGVQWHPENLIHDDPAMLRLFSGLVEAAAVGQPAGY